MAFALNFGFTLVELVGAWLTNSTAIAADAVHDLGDSLALGFAWGMQGLSEREATDTYTYGFRRLSLLAATVNALVLMIGSVIVMGEALPRLFDPPNSDPLGMLGLAVLGVAVNGAAVLRTRDGHTMNEKVVSLHLLEDVLGWVVVAVCSVIMLVVDVPWLDPLLSLGISAWLIWNATRYFTHTVQLFLQAVPPQVRVRELCEAVASREGVKDLCCVHVWSEDGENHVLTGSLVVEPMPLADAIAVQDGVKQFLESRGIGCATLELSLTPHEA